MSQLLQRLAKRFSGLPSPATVDAETAYNEWAATYDEQPENLMLALDERLVGRLLEHPFGTLGTILDIGCGTGRHWPKLMELKPAKLIGTDVSAGMLARLQQKFPAAEIFHTPDGNLPGIPTASIDLLFTTLTIAHIQDVATAIKDWVGVLRPGGYILITDYHPAALQRGAKRTFQLAGETTAIQNYVHQVPAIVGHLESSGCAVIERQEIVVDESMRHFYEQQHALHLFEKWKGTPIIFGLLLKKTHAAA